MPFIYSKHIRNLSSRLLKCWPTPTPSFFKKNVVGKNIENPFANSCSTVKHAILLSKKNSAGQAASLEDMEMFWIQTLLPKASSIHHMLQRCCLAHRAPLALCIVLKITTSVIPRDPISLVANFSMLMGKNIWTSNPDPDGKLRNIEFQGGSNSLFFEEQERLINVMYITLTTHTN